MNRISHLLIAGAIGCILASYTTMAQSPAEVTLTRFDCGGGNPIDIARFSDTYAYQGKSQTLTASCYLVRHADEYLIWDTGYSTGGAAGAATPKTSLVEQLAQLQLQPEQIKYVGISHYHGDHIGQAGSFPQATLLIGQGDWNALTAAQRAPGVNPEPVAHWISGGGKVEPVPRDKDIFGDGSVVMLDLPGHTPGHHGLLVRLKAMGNVLLSGDLAHFRENYDSDGVPSFNTHRAETLASLARFKEIAKHLNATVIIQHDPRDVAKLPAFPAAAK